MLNRSSYKKIKSKLFNEVVQKQMHEELLQNNVHLIALFGVAKATSLKILITD